MARREAAAAKNPLPTSNKTTLDGGGNPQGLTTKPYIYPLYQKMIELGNLDGNEAEP